MKVCLVVDNLNISNGGGRLARNFVESFAGTEIEFEIVSFNPPAVPLPVPLTILRSVWWHFLVNVWKIRSIARRCDIVHSFDFYPNALLSSLALVGMKKGHVVTVMGTCSVSPLNREPHSMLIKSFAGSVDAIISISSYTAQKIREKLPTLSLSVIPPFSFARPITTGEVPTAEFVNKIQGVKPYIVSVLSVLKERKGCIENLRVFSRLAEQMPSLNYVIVATPDGSSYSQSVVAEIERLNLGDRVHFIGGLSEVELSHVYANADLHLMLSHYDAKAHDIEGFGLVYLEASSHGILSIGNYDSGARDAIEEGVSGTLIRARNNDELTERAYQAALLLLQKRCDPQTSEQAKDFSHTFSSKRSVEAYRTLYYAVIKSEHHTKS
ncbi:MAG: L-malate glycosyltransferase [Patescibacteria group bacterium]|jgi:phosphatidylinositol alpha-1,6-mannosyltransferase|nr:L-malate glycosyltransferase [Patescibacteria group bacterium]